VESGAQFNRQGKEGMKGRMHFLQLPACPSIVPALDVRGTALAMPLARKTNCLVAPTRNGTKVCKMKRALNAWFEDGPSKRRRTYRVLVGRVLQRRGWFVERALSSKGLLIVVRQDFLNWSGRCVSWRNLAISSPAASG
jgi:hypothetical protein